MTDSNDPPLTVEELSVKVDATFIRQEHRLYHIVRNAWEYSSLGESDPRRDASRSAFVFRLLMAFLPGAAIATTGIAAFVGLSLAWEANKLLNEQNVLIRQQAEEQLTIELDPLVNGPVRITKHNYGNRGRVVQFPWKLTVSNTGQQNLSFDTYSLRQGIPPRSVSYTGINGGLFTEDLKPVSLPETLAAGEAKKYYILVGLLIPPAVFAKFPTIADDQELLDRDLSIALAKQGIDVFGNPVEYKDIGGVMIQYLEAEKAPLYLCTIHTKRRTAALAVAQKYTPMLSP